MPIKDRKCTGCGEVFRSVNKFWCSMSCWQEHRKRKITKLNCNECGREFAISTSRIAKGEGKFCSRSCFYGNVVRTKGRVGSKNPSYKGGDLL